MNIEVRDSNLQARIQKQLEATGSTSVEEVLVHLLETQEEQDRWLLENRERSIPSFDAEWGSLIGAKESLKISWTLT